MEELPHTGTNGTLVVVAAVLLALGCLAVSLGLPRNWGARR